MGVQINPGSMLSNSSSAGPPTSSNLDQLLGHPQQQQPQAPVSVNVVEGHVIQQQLLNPVPLSVGVPVGISTGQPGGDTSSTQSILSSQARRLLEESVVASDEGDR